MAIGLRWWGNRFLCVEANDPAGTVFSDHVNLDRCGEVAIRDEGNGLVSVLFVDAQRQFTITDPPNPRFETRARGAVGAWETFTPSADRTSISRVGVTVEVVGWTTPPTTLLHLEQRGNDFVDAQGNRVVMAGIDGFDDLWFRTQGRENELDALMRESQQLKFRIRRVWCMGDAGENQVFSLYPQNTPGYFDMVRGLVAYENGYGQIPLLTACVDAQRVMPNRDQVLGFWRDLNDALRGSGSYAMSVVNQWTKNLPKDVKPSDFANPGGGVIWSRGSDVDDTKTSPDGNGGKAPASELHATRVSFERALMDSTASPPNMRANGSGMVWMTEGNPFGDGGGYTAPQAWKLGRGYSIEWALAVFHNRQSQRGQLMQEATATQAEQFERGARLG